MKTSATTKKKKRKIYKPVTDNDIEKKAKSGNKLITAVHNFNKEIRLIKKNGSLTDIEKKRKIEEIHVRIIEIGGIEAYQNASLKGERHHGNFNSAQWIVQKLRDFKVIPNENGRLKLLDVGALDTVYQKYNKWIDWTAIDLNPQKPEIEKEDFLHFKPGSVGLYDVVVLSLVINFSGDTVERGQMLQKARQLTKHNGYLAVVLPLACLSNSRYLNHKLFKDMLKCLGFETEYEHNSKKLSFKMFKKTGKLDKTRSFAKKEIRGGGGKNNFCIVLR